MKTALKIPFVCGAQFGRKPIDDEATVPDCDFFESAAPTDPETRRMYFAGGGINLCRFFLWGENHDCRNEKAHAAAVENLLKGGAP